MKIVLSTTSSHPDYFADCESAVVDLTATLMGQIRHRVELARRVALEDEELCELRFWDGVADFYGYTLIAACEDAVAAGTDGSEKDKNAAASAWSSALERVGHALLPAGVDLDAQKPQRTESVRMIVECGPTPQHPQCEIAWTAIPKHSDLRVTTMEVRLADLEAYASGQSSESKPSPSQAIRPPAARKPFTIKPE